MTEQEWLVSTDLYQMLDFACGVQARLNNYPVVTTVGGHNRMSGRKRRLLACAWVRPLWGKLRAAERDAVEIAEKYADDCSFKGELDFIREQLFTFTLAGQTSLSRCVYWLTGSCKLFPPGLELLELDKDLQLSLLRDVVNPFWPDRDNTFVGLILWPLVPVLGVSLADRCRSIAEEAYQDRRWDVLPVLADALEDAGCCESVILEHLRGPGPHCRGCWVLGMILGKE